MIKIGVVGCGHWGNNHVRIFNMTEGVRLGLCCDSDHQRVRRLHAIYPGLPTSLDHRDVMNDENIDAVVIATPTATHYAIVKAALTKGKHVLCEKPLTIKEKESEELVALARKKQKILMVGYVFLFNNGIVALKESIEKNSLGKIQYLHFTRTNLGPIRDDVDVTYDLASHDIAIASFLLGKWPIGASANAGFFLRKKISDAAFITLYYPNNVLANIHVSWLDPKKIRMLTCVGDRKMAVWDDLETSEPIRIFDKGVTKEPFYSDYGEFQLLTREGEVVSPLVKLVEPLRNQNAHFIECIEKGKTPLTDAVFAHRITKVLEAVQLSIKNKGRIERIR